MNLKLLILVCTFCIQVICSGECQQIGLAKRQKRDCNNGGCNGSNNGGSGCNKNGNCDRNGGNGGGNGGGSNSRSGGGLSGSGSSAGGLSLRDLLVLLPFLTQPRYPPAIGTVPTLPALPAPSNIAAGTIFELAKTITKRQISPAGRGGPSKAELRQELRKMMMEEARRMMIVDGQVTPQPFNRSDVRGALQHMMAEEAKRMASVVVTVRPTFGPKLAVPTSPIPTPSTTPAVPTGMPASEFVDDYDVTPPPPDMTNFGKVSPGDVCNRNNDCVQGATCERGAVAGLLKYCVCKFPLVGYDGFCVMPGTGGR